MAFTFSPALRLMEARPLNAATLHGSIANARLNSAKARSGRCRARRDSPFATNFAVCSLSLMASRLEMDDRPKISLFYIARADFGAKSSASDALRVPDEVTLRRCGERIPASPEAGALRRGINRSRFSRDSQQTSNRQSDYGRAWRG